jgi:hypothetical protein
MTSIYRVGNVYSNGVIAMVEESKFHSELIELPSKGWFYPPTSPMASGKIELLYMTAAHEDILTSKSWIQKGVVLDKLMEALLVDKTVSYDDLLVGDKNALMVAARVLGYGKTYKVTMACPQCEFKTEQEINLEEFPDKDIEFAPAQKGKNEFLFELPISGKVISFKLLTQKDIKAAEKELSALEKVSKGGTSKEVTTRMKYSILSIDGNPDKKELIEFIANMPARDAMAWREYAKSINPDIEMLFDFECSKCGFTQGGTEVPIDANFFWPNA